MNIEKRFEDVAGSTTYKRIRKVFNFKNKKILDIGCGWGEYLADCGAGSMGITSTPAEVEYGIKRGLRIVFGNAEELDKTVQDTFDIIWANNLFEHLLSPHAFLMKLRPFGKNKTILILGVPVIPKIVSLLKITRWRGALATPHINFFTAQSLKLTVQATGWHVLAVRPFWFSSSLIDRIFMWLAPHAYVVAELNESFVYPEKKLKEWLHAPYYQPLLEITGQEKE